MAIRGEKSSLKRDRVRPLSLHPFLCIPDANRPFLRHPPASTPRTTRRSRGAPRASPRKAPPP